MQAELKAARPQLNIEILGVNRSADSQFNSLVSATQTRPWLQDTVYDAVWTRWQVVYRDVRILDSANRLRGVFNLTSFDLANSTNYMTLKQMFLEAAKVVDSDGDNLPDDWEQRNFKNLTLGAGDDPDGDRRDNFTELAFGTNPTNANSFYSPQASVSVAGSERTLMVTFRRPAGSLLDYFIEASPDLQAWTPDTAELTEARAPRPLFDGTGTMEVFYSLAKPMSVRTSGFVRVRAVPKPPP